MLDSDHLCKFSNHLLQLSTLSVQFFKRKSELSMSLV